MNTHYSIRSNVLEWVEAGGHEMPTTNQYLLKLNTIHNKSQFKDSWSMIFIKNITLKTKKILIQEQKIIIKNMMNFSAKK